MSNKLSLGLKRQRSLDIVDSKVSFSAADSDSEQYVKMFSDSTIAKSFQQKNKKLKYMIQFGIVPYLKELTLKELVDLPFSFRFDESKTSKIKKQYDAYATYQSNHFSRILSGYLETLFCR